MGLLTELRRSITRLWGRTEQAVGEAYGNEALEYEGAADEAKVDAEEAADDSQDQPDDGTAASPAR
ncbi:MAG: CsbD family protein [Actinomycetota bacterium]|nr:CsbD family protein [Actinomycetota bacterium]